MAILNSQRFAAKLSPESLIEITKLQKEKIINF